MYSYKTRSGLKVSIDKKGNIYINDKPCLFEDPMFDIELRIDYTDGNATIVSSSCSGKPKQASSLINVWSILGNFFKWYYKSDKPEFTIASQNQHTIIKRSDIKRINFGYKDRTKALDNFNWHAQCQMYKTIKRSRKYKFLSRIYKWK